MPDQGKVFECSECSNTYSRNENLQIHIRQKHLKQRPFKCPQCSKSFASQDSCKKHEQSVHDKLKRYVCEPCGLRFSQSTTLRRHQRTKKHLDMVSSSTGPVGHAIHLSRDTAEQVDEQPAASINDQESEAGNEGIEESTASGLGPYAAQLSPNPTSLRGLIRYPEDDNALEPATVFYHEEDIASRSLNAFYHEDDIVFTETRIGATSSLSHRPWTTYGSFGWRESYTCVIL